MGSAERGHSDLFRFPRFFQFIALSPFSSDLRSLFSGFVPICSDFFRFVFRTNQGNPFLPTPCASPREMQPSVGRFGKGSGGGRHKEEKVLKNEVQRLISSRNVGTSWTGGFKSRERKGASVSGRFWRMWSRSSFGGPWVLGVRSLERGGCSPCSRHHFNICSKSVRGSQWVQHRLPNRFGVRGQIKIGSRIGSQISSRTGCQNIGNDGLFIRCLFTIFAPHNPPSQPAK